jgi:hypothetical protein
LSFFGFFFSRLLFWSPLAISLSSGFDGIRCLRRYRTA